MKSYYPTIEPYATHHIEVDKPHVLYVEECGNPNGLPVIFLHGGPGMGCTPDHRRYFNPDIYRVIIFDQRGAGRSTPKGETTNNNTQALVSDIETIRKKLGVEKWIVFGGSWGSALSMVYAISHSENILGLILRGIFNGRKKEIDWIFNGGGAKSIFPDHFETYQTPIPVEKQNNYLSAYYEIFNSDNDVAKMAAAKAMATWDAQCMTLEPNSEILEAMLEPGFALPAAKIVFHYFINNCFLDENFILTNTEKFSHLPGIIVHGRYDLITPLINAWDLHKKWPNSDLRIVHDAGHAGFEPGTIAELVKATDEMAEKFR